MQAGESSILVTSDYEKEVFLSSRNLQKADVVRAAELRYLPDPEWQIQ
jgi:hypothetical protein